MHKVVNSLFVNLAFILAITSPIASWAEDKSLCRNYTDIDGNIRSNLLPPIDQYAPDVVPLANEPLAALSVPMHHSKPSATKKIFLDFDGHVVTGTIWNSSNSNLPIHAPPYSTDGDLTTFTSSELNNIEQIWRRVSEDFSPYQVDVTTVDPGLSAFAAGNVAIRALISTDYDEAAVGGTGTRWSTPSSGGVAYLNSWAWTSDTPAWIFENNLGNGNVKYVSEAISHEVGHTLGLNHDGNNTVGYYEGHGSGDTGWAPIMGVGYYKPVSQWSKGEYPNANNLEDDLLKINNYLGSTADDHGGTIGSATALTVSGQTSISGNGNIGNRTDVDYLSFTTGAGLVTINVLPFAYPTKGYANLDIQLELYRSDGTLVTSSNPATGLEASINSLNLTAGTYYIKIDGVGKDTDYSDYASLGWYTISGTIQDASGLDSSKPTGTLQYAPAISVSSSSNYSLGINYIDDNAIKVSSLNTNDIQVTGPNGFSQIATFISATPNSDNSPIYASYSITPPGGTWDYLDNGTYTVALRPNEVNDTTDNYGLQATLGTFSVSIHTAPSILTNPISQGILEGQTAIFSCSGSGEPTLSYQWQKNGVNIPGAEGTSYAFVSALTDSGQSYRCIVSNNYGSSISSSAILTVSPQTYYSIGGTITLKGSNISGLRVVLSTGTSTTTDSQGRFSFTGLLNNLSYTITPSQVGYEFNPTSLTGTINGSSVTGANFSTTCAPYYVEGGGHCSADIPYAPSSINTTRGTRSDKVIISWASVPTANEYLIYRIPIEGGTLINIGSTSTLSYSDTQAIVEQVYIYSVSAKNETGEGARTSGSDGWRADPYSADCDKDGVLDADEELDGTNPYDRGSVHRLMSGEACSEWNGFLQPMFQVKELLNFSTTDTLTSTTLYSIDGVPQSSVAANIPAKGKLDLLIHQMSGFTANSYGRVCVRFPKEQSIDGGMSFYKYPTNPTSTQDMSFAYMAPFLPPITGSQVVPINTYQPSLRYDQALNGVTNWIQFSNASTTESLSGELQFFMQGSSNPVCTRAVSLAPSQRFDTPAHSKVPGEIGCDALGQSRVGFLMWKPYPGFELVPATIRNVRYIYNNPNWEPSFTTAFQLEGEVASGEKIFVGLDTRGASAILEVTNVLEEAQLIDIKLYNKNGVLSNDLSRTFEARSSIHFIADDLIKNDLAVAVVKGSSAEGVSAVAMEYGRNIDASIKWMYGTVARQAFGSELAGGYNTFLGQGCKIMALNTGATSSLVDISLLSSTGSLLSQQLAQSIPANGLKEFSCDPGQADTYGAVILNTPSKSVIGSIIRVGAGDRYRFPTPLRSMK